MSPLRYRNLLSIKQDGKVVPYGGSGEPREDGEANYGFFNLKENIEQASSVPELARDPALLALALAINSPTSGLFSLGSTSGEVADADGYRWSGYIEFALNSRTRVVDASSYFPVFFYFDDYLSKIQSNLQVQFQWELMAAHFSDLKCDGFTCSIFVNTYYVVTPEEAKNNWAEALGIVQNFIEDFGQELEDAIYKST